MSAPDPNRVRAIVKQVNAFLDGARIGSMERYLTPADLFYLATAAESTLPKKPVWHLTGSGSKSGPPFERLCTALEEKHVAGFVDLLLKDGFSEILVERKG